jgi:hypothetical protein
MRGPAATGPLVLEDRFEPVVEARVAAPRAVPAAGRRKRCGWTRDASCVTVGQEPCWGGADGVDIGRGVWVSSPTDA